MTLTAALAARQCIDGAAAGRSFDGSTCPRSAAERVLWSRACLAKPHTYSSATAESLTLTTLSAALLVHVATMRRVGGRG